MKKIYSLIGVLALFLMLGAACDPSVIPTEQTDTIDVPNTVMEQEVTPTAPADPNPPAEDNTDETAPEGLLDAIDAFENQDPDEEPRIAEAENAPCNNNAQCIPGKLCVDNECVPAETVLPTNEDGSLVCNNNAQCIPGKLCVDGNCVPAETVLLPEEAPEFSPCNNDAQCIAGKVCNQGGCVAVPESCNFNPECYSDDYICMNNNCVGPTLHQQTCTNYNAERWFCPTSQDCGDDLGSCFDVL